MRERFQLWTIGACDLTKEQRKARRKKHQRQREMARRRKAGMDERATYLASHTTSRDQPWIALGMSRASYYRRRKAGETSPCAADSSSLVSTDLSHASKPPRKRPSRPRPASRLPDDLTLASTLALPGGEARPQGISALGHPLHHHWPSGIIVSMWRPYRLAASDHGPTLGPVS